MMHDTLLRVFVVGLSLLLYPTEDPDVKELDGITMVGLQKHEERLLRGSDKLLHKMASAREEVLHTDDERLQSHVKSTPEGKHQSDHHFYKKDQSVLKDVAVTQKDSEESNADHMSPESGHLITDLDPRGPQNSKTESRTALKVPQTDPKQMVEDIQTKSSIRELSRPQVQQERPEEKEEFTSEEQKSHLRHIHAVSSENEISEKAIVDSERDYLWCIWNIFSVISIIQFFRKHLRTSQSKEETRLLPVTFIATEAPLPDSNTLQKFYSKCILAYSHEKQSEGVFLEGLANDLLAAMKTVCDRDGAMVLEDLQMVDVCDIIVPFRPSEPYSFQCLLCNNQATDLLSYTQVCGQIKLVEETVQTDCHCQSPGADDIVCLLHCGTESRAKITVSDTVCMKNSPFLSKSQVTAWFRRTIKQAWTVISHKYEFGLNICNINAPGSLVVRFRSGKKIYFSMNPVVKFNTDSHFFITPCSLAVDTLWSLSLKSYEDHFLEGLSKRLPENACHIKALELTHFLHKRQTSLSGSCALNNFHFKTALMHLLLTRDPAEWKPNYLASRLRDLLHFVEKSLETKLLLHVLIGNPLTVNVIDVPAELTEAKPVNLFHPLVVHNCIYRNTVAHFHEMLRNAHMLIHDYVDRYPNSGKHLIH